MILLLLLFHSPAFALATSPDTLSGKPAPRFRMPDQNTSAPATFAIADQFAPDSQHAVIISFFAT